MKGNSNVSDKYTVDLTPGRGPLKKRDEKALRKKDRAMASSSLTLKP